MKRSDIINIVAVLSLVLPPLLGTLAAQRSADRPGAMSSDEASIHGFGDSDKTCLEWTDSCRTCLRAANTVVCPNIGIACQPKPITCTRREEAPKPEAPPKQEGAPK